MISLQSHLGQLFMIGFQGVHPEDKGAQEAIALAKEGLIGGIVFFEHNLVNKEQIIRLVNTFKELKLDQPLLLAIDQEGGAVQRLAPKNGFHQFPSAHDVGCLEPFDALSIYKDMAHDVAEAGFNMVLGPVVDLHHDKSQIIGKLKRSFHKDPLKVVTYAKAFIQAFSERNIITCLKHFPGHGLATHDSHKQAVDITSTHREIELIPFRRLIDEETIPMIMSAHVMHKDYDSVYPATLSKKLLRPLLNKPFEGVFVSDDLMMEAIQRFFPLNVAVLQAFNAGIDMVLLSYNPKASLEHNKVAIKHVYKTHKSIFDYITNSSKDKNFISYNIKKSSERILMIKKYLIN